MPITPSLKLIELLEKLTRDWNDWKNYRDYYINELLPSLKNDPEHFGSTEERRIITQIQSIASQEEWDCLGIIVAGLDKFRDESSDLNKTINSLFDSKQYKEAKRLYGISAPVIYKQAEQERISIVTSRFSGYLAGNNLTLAERTLQVDSELLTEEDRSKLANMLQEEEIHITQQVKERITILLNEYKFSEAEFAYSKISSRFPCSEYKKQVQVARENEAKATRRNFVQTQIERLANLLIQYKFDEADIVYKNISDDYRAEDYDNLVKKYRLKQEKEQLLGELKVILSKGNFSAADRVFSKSNLLTPAEYLQIKSEYVKTVLSGYGEETCVNDEQALALSQYSKHILVTARAGSGKTRLLSAKTLLLIDYEHVDPDHILVMAFNHDAARTVKTRIRNLAKSSQAKAFENARTFHSLAYQIVQPTGQLLFDNRGEFVRKEFSEFVQSVFREIMTNEDSIHLYEFFRWEMASIQRSGALKDDKEYYLFIRNQRYSTLRGEKVKSLGEKYIADFLFEYDISYGYEKDYLWGNSIYRPDFSMYIDNIQYIIEHWGIDENDPRRSANSNWDGNWEDYREQMQRKRNYWLDRSRSNIGKTDFVLIETSIADLKDGRDTFEGILKDKLAANGIIHEKLSQEELIAKTHRQQIDRMTALLTQFILKAKKKRWSAETAQEIIARSSGLDVKIRYFLDLGQRVYAAYEARLLSCKKIDFDELINQAIQRIHTCHGDLEISADGGHSRSLKLADLEWLLIDEYQDFSLLFHDLVQSIKRYSPELKIACVGDDWQAINSFAGSDLSYFREFTTIFPEAHTAPLTTNYRSKSVIVEAGNHVMQGFGIPGKSGVNQPGGHVFIDDIEALRLNYKIGDMAETNPDVKFLFFNQVMDGAEKLRPNSYIIGKYLKACHNIIADHINEKKSFVILSRNNQIYGVDSEEFLAKLLSSFSREEKDSFGNNTSKLKISTVHSYKGLEADCVILLQACEGIFPTIHPDNRLFEIFGQTQKSLLDEERRLFYVAVTRARENLFILTENSRKSDFLVNLSARPFFQ